MAGSRSFKDYVADRFENELFTAIQSYTAEHSGYWYRVGMYGSEFC